MSKLNTAVAAAEAMMLYLLTGSACLVIGSSVPQLMAHFNADLVTVASMGSAYAVGRVATVFATGRLTEKIGPIKVLGGGLVLLCVFMAGLPHAPSVPAALALCALGGAGMGTQDATCPVILSRVFPTHYPSALSAGQAFFGAGCFLPPMLMGVVLPAGLPFYYTYYVFAGLCAVMLLLLPLAGLGNERADKGSVGVRSAEHEITGGPKRDWIGVVLLATVCASYCGITNTINLYTATYADFLGIPEGLAVNVLAMYNVGGMLGSLLFTWVLRRVKPVNLLCVNFSAALACLLVSLLANSFFFMAACYFLVGIFLGVVFSINVTLAVGLWHGRAGRAGAVVAMLSGGADIVAPLITGAVITATGIGANIWFALAFAAVSLAAALLLRRRIGGNKQAYSV